MPAPMNSIATTYRIKTLNDGDVVDYGPSPLETLPDVDEVQQPARQTISILDKRPTATEKANFSGDYDRETIRTIASHAKKKGIDPYTALAISLQENNLGNTGGVGWGNWNLPKEYFEDEGNRQLQQAASDVRHKNYFPRSNEVSDQRQEMRDEHGDENLQKLKESPFWKDSSEQLARVREQEARDPAILDNDASLLAANIADKYQYARNLYGKNAPEELLIQAYNGLGKTKKDDGTVVDHARERPYGKRIIALRQHAIMNNPEIQSIIRAVEEQDQGGRRSTGLAKNVRPIR